MLYCYKDRVGLEIKKNFTEITTEKKINAMMFRGNTDAFLFPNLIFVFLSSSFEGIWKAIG